MALEFCSKCDEPTGNSGRGEDSIYIELQNIELGPLCLGCSEQILAKMPALQGENNVY